MTSSSYSEGGLSKKEKWILLPPLIIVAILIAIFLIFSGYAIIRDNIDEASLYGQFVGGLGTIGLIILTGWYAYQTRQMVSQQRQAHKEDLAVRRKRRRREVNGLRRALVEEIGKIGYLEELADNYHSGYSHLNPIVPKTIYRTKGSDLGLLTEDEIDVVVEYYTRAQEVETLMEVQRKEDTTLDTIQLLEIFDLSEKLVERIFQILSLGVYKPEWKRREETIQESLEGLADAQNRALFELNQNLTSESPSGDLDT
jgi:hypothetical protein